MSNGADGIGSVGGTGTSPCRTTDRSEEELLLAAEAMRAQSALRAAVFGDRSTVFRDPAWEMLLEAYISGAKGGPVPIKVMCAVSGVPTTTALRCIAALEANGLLYKAPNQRDRRSTLLRLTEWARSAMVEVLNGQPSR